VKPQVDSAAFVNAAGVFELLVQEEAADAAAVAFDEFVAESLVAFAYAPDETGIGASLSAADETLQAQLKLTKGQGLVVTGVTADSAAAKAGILVDDILLLAGDRALAKPSDVGDIVRSPVKKPFAVEFTLLRAGERQKVSLTVPEDATLERVAVRFLTRSVEEPSYRIGVEASDAGSTLRAQLKLPKDQGVVLDRVLPDSPALKAGFQQYDVLLTVDSKSLAKSEDLSAAVKGSEGKALKFTLVRGGEKREITVTPEKRATEALAAHLALGSRVRVWDANSGKTLLREYAVRNTRAGDTGAQIERMLKQVDELRDAVQALQRTVAKEQSKVPPKTDLPKPQPPGKVEPPK
jgi:C-terminal processing protease CtpA/Prc